MSITRAMASKAIVFSAFALMLGFAIGRLSAGGAGVWAATTSGTPDPAAATTQTAERIELDRLRTQIARAASPAACTPPPTSTPQPSPTPTAVPTPVPPAAAGQPLPYAGDWTVQVIDLALLPNFSDLTPQGIYARVSLLITNNTGTARSFPYDELVLRDEQGRTFVTPLEIKTRNEAGWFSPFPPFLPTDGFVIFDIATDATGPFILESTADPTFRVQIVLEQRG